ncbi:hypothetical protein LSAT2_007863 [Lamellibrachia satsuma]|nr:hypothetical protein LSAT2_007863 [Lamellibrachia satsuma]
MYESVIRPVLEYASLTWNPFCTKEINELEKVQKRALKLSRTPVESVLLEQRRLEVDFCEDLYVSVVYWLHLPSASLRLTTVVTCSNRPLVTESRVEDQMTRHPSSRRH